MADSYELEPTPPPPPPTLPPAQSVLDDAGDRCPRCGKPLPLDTVLCMHCGYDMKAGRTQSTHVGDPEEIDREAGKPKPLSPLKGIKQPVLVGIGITLLVLAVAVTIWFVPSGAAWYVYLARPVVIILQAATHTATGVAALWVCTRVLKRPAGSYQLAAARLFVAVSAFLLMFSIRIDPPWLSAILAVVLAAGAYWGCVLLLFTRDVSDTNTLAAVHAGMALVLSGLTHLSALANSGLPAPVAGSIF